MIKFKSLVSRRMGHDGRAYLDEAWFSTTFFAIRLNQTDTPTISADSIRLLAPHIHAIGEIPGGRIEALFPVDRVRFDKSPWIYDSANGPARIYISEDQGTVIAIPEEQSQVLPIDVLYGSRAPRPLVNSNEDDGITVVVMPLRFKDGIPLLKGMREFAFPGPESLIETTMEIGMEAEIQDAETLEGDGEMAGDDEEAIEEEVVENDDTTMEYGEEFHIDGVVGAF